MSMQTYFVVQPYQETPRGALEPLPPIAARDADHARRLAARQEVMAAGVIVFSRRADPDIGDYDEAVVLSRWGRLPDEDAAAA